MEGRTVGHMNDDLSRFKKLRICTTCKKTYYGGLTSKYCIDCKPFYGWNSKSSKSGGDNQPKTR